MIDRKATRVGVCADSLVAPDCWMVDLLLKCALVMGETLRTASETKLLAQIVASFSTDTALPACNANL